MKNIYWILGLCLLISCSNENQRFEQKEATLFLALSVSDNSPHQTKAVIYENDIKEIDLIIFKRKGRQDFFYDHFAVPASEIEDIDTPDGLKKGFYVTLDPEVAEIGARLMIIANCRSIVNKFISDNNINKDSSTERRIFQDGLSFVGYKWKQRNKPPYDVMPMCGISDYYVVAEENGEIQQIEMDLFQALARIDVGVDIYNNKSTLRDEFIITDVYVFGTHTSGRITRNFDELLGSPETTMTNLPDKDDPAFKRVLDYRHWYQFPTNSYEMRETIYATESAELNQSEPFSVISISTGGIESPITYQDPVSFPYNGTFLVLKATYNGVPNRYYRVDFNDGYDFLPLIRNNRYEINIREVSHAGDDRLDLAMTKVYSTRSQSIVNASGLGVEIRINP